MKVDLIYVADLYCLWCYGFSETVNRIASEYAEQIELRLINGGMIRQDIPLRTFFGRFPDPIGLHRRVADMSGQKIGASYVNQIRNLETSKRSLNSLKPARAIAALNMLGASDSLKVMSEMQIAHYVWSLDLFDPESYRSMPCMKLVNFELFKIKFLEQSSLDIAVKDIHWVDATGVGGFPALLLKQSETPHLQYLMIARGFTPYDAIKSKLDEALGSILVPDQAVGLACRLDGTGC